MLAAWLGTCWPGKMSAVVGGIVPALTQFENLVQRQTPMQPSRAPNGFLTLGFWVVQASVVSEMATS